ncbi:hypothetical protein PoB_004956400 [Plakobranchus ocellatus]|uniref:Uncharacterized protein n=1 Tax=Plakobranchus ocellatus TaxID=259542 RepID=A0AAV4BSB8_9GAST|nr:hypothetical protein PoB_004956400 [Plakobranchus ocellatus]
MFPFTSCVSILRRKERPADWRQINGSLTFLVCTPNNNHNHSINGNSSSSSSNSSDAEGSNSIRNGRAVASHLDTVEEEVSLCLSLL